MSVHGLLNQTHYNGCRGVVTKLIASVPDNKCEITVTSGLGNTEKLLILKTRCLNLVARCGERMAQAGVCEMESVARRPET